MYQQTYCLTLPKPFFKIFLFRIYVPTIHSTDIAFDETSVRFPQISAPIQPTQTNPPTTLPTHSTNTTDTATIHNHKFHTRARTASTNTHNHTAPHPHAPHTTNTHNHTAPHPYSLHRHPQPPQTAIQPHKHTQPRSTPARPPTQTLTPTHREAMPCPDVDAQPASSGLTVRPSGRPASSGPIVGPRRPDGRTRRRSPRSFRTSQSDRPGTRQDQIEPSQARPDQAKPLTTHSPGPAGRSPQIFPPNLTAD